MKILLTGAYNYNKEQLNKIQSLGYHITFIQDERIPLDIDVTDFEVVICNGLFLYNDIEKFRNLKFIQLTSAGMDRVPLDYLKKNSIKIENAKGVYSVPMAEWVILKILEIYKGSKKFYKNQDEHMWEKQRDLLELTDKTVAIVGFGDVGAEVAKRLRIFGVNIIGVGRKKRRSDLVNEFYSIDDINTVINKSDIVILTLPLTERTKHLIDANKITNMKDNSVIVNVSRGGIIDESALVEALQRGKFLGVALDVFGEEPLCENNVLWDFENVSITPHNSFISDKTNDRLFKLILNNLTINASK